MSIYNHKNSFFIVAKTDKIDTSKWLPLLMHLKDTSGIMHKLINKWLPESTIRATGLEYDDFLKSACFLASVHDIGKATSYFQYIITSKLPEKRLELNENGFVVNEVYPEAGRTPHAYAGEEIIKHILYTKEYGEEENYKINSYASVVGAHHGKPKENKLISGCWEDYFRDYKRNLYGSEEKSDSIAWEMIWESIINNAYRESGVTGFSKLPNINFEAQTIMSGLLIMADWLASNSYYFPLIDLNDYGGDFYPERIECGWEKLEFPERWESETYSIDNDDFQNRFGFVPNEVQEKFVNLVNNTKKPGLFILEAQMGVGKTEAALAAVEILSNRCGAGGIFFGLPTQATSNGIFQRLMEWAAGVSEDTVNSVRLAHGSAELNDEYIKYELKGNSLLDEDSEENGIGIHPWFKGNKKALLADFVVGTVDQFLLATLKRKHFMLRHLGLSGKIVVIDECHAYDAYMNVYLLNSLRWMGAYGIPVILLSATLPKNRREKFIDAYSKSYVKCYLKENPKKRIEAEGWRESKNYPLFTWTDGKNINQTSVEFNTTLKKIIVSYNDSIEGVLQGLRGRLSDGGCACIILNTVKEAQKVYQIANKLLSDKKIILYHAQFIMTDRINKETELLRVMGKRSNDEERNGTILIGTQVLEQSLDYDADIMITQPCPIDLLLQRVGRLHRHDRKRAEKLKEAECILLLDADSKSGFDKGSEKIYGEYLLVRSLNLLKEYKEKISIPKDISEMVQKVYDEKYPLGETDDASKKYISVLKDKENRAKGFMLGKPNIKAEENMDNKLNYEKTDGADAAVRDGSNSVDVILMRSRPDGTAGFISENPNERIYKNQIPQELIARKIARQKIKLPSVFSLNYSITGTIRELEDITRNECIVWQQSPWLEGELVLFLNEEGQGELNGYKIRYTQNTGFEYEKI